MIALGSLKIPNCYFLCLKCCFLHILTQFLFFFFRDIFVSISNFFSFFVFFFFRKILISFTCFFRSLCTFDDICLTFFFYMQKKNIFFIRIFFIIFFLSLNFILEFPHQNFPHNTNFSPSEFFQNFLIRIFFTSIRGNFNIINNILSNLFFL